MCRRVLLKARQGVGRKGVLKKIDVSLLQFEQADRIFRDDSKEKPGDRRRPLEIISESSELDRFIRIIPDESKRARSDRMGGEGPGAIGCGEKFWGDPLGHLGEEWGMRFL